MWPFSRKKEKKPVPPPEVETSRNKSGDAAHKKPTQEVVGNVVKVFNNHRELLQFLGDRVLPSVERATDAEMDAFPITARIKGQTAAETSLSTFQQGLFQLSRRK